MPSTEISSEELDILGQDLEENFKKGLILVSGFDAEPSSDSNLSQRRKVYAIKLLIKMNCIRLFVLGSACFFRSSDRAKMLRLFSVDILYGFGSFGCLINQVVFLGFLVATNYLDVVQKHEKTGKLHMISHIKNHRNYEFTPLERNKFSTYLKLIKLMRTIALCMVVIPLTLFHAVGGIVTSWKLGSIAFTFPAVIMTLNYGVVFYYAANPAIYSLLMVAHSSNLLTIRFNRLIDQMNRFHCQCGQWSRRKKISMVGYKDIAGRLQEWSKSAGRRVKEFHSVLYEVESVLHEVRQHNETVKHILESCVHYAVPAVGLLLEVIFFAGDIKFWYKVIVLNTAFFASSIFYQMLFKACQIYSLTRKVCNLLHGIQVRVGRKEKKRKLHVLRLIYRTSDCSTWNCKTCSLPIGFTIGNQGSFSPFIAVASTLQVAIIALTFHNAKYST